MVANSDSCAKQLPVTGICFNTHSLPTPLLTNNVHIKNCHEAVPWLFKHLVVVGFIKNQKSRLLVLVALKDRQLNLHRHRISFNIFNDSMKLCVMNVDVGNFHARKFLWLRNNFRFHTAPAFCCQPKSFLALITSKMGAGMSLLKDSSPEWILARTSPE